MNKKKLVIIFLIIIILIGIYMLYNTFAISSYVSDNSDTYTINLTEDNNTITIPSKSSKTVIYQIKNTNKGKVKYAVGYNTSSNIEVKVYEDSIDKESDYIDYGEYKFVKLKLINNTTTTDTVSLSTVLGYENGGNLIVPSNTTLVTEKYIKPVNFAKHITTLYINADKTKVTNNNIEYNYATSINLMNDRLGGTTPSLDGGNIRYYGVYKKVTEIATEPVYAWQTIGLDLAKQIGLEDGFTSEDNCLTILTENLPNCKKYSDYGYDSEEKCETELSSQISEITGGAATTVYGICSAKIADKGDEIMVSKPIDNYVYFNCEEYPSTNCELWRIIGVFDGKIKLIRNENIGSYSWDTSTSTVNSGSGVNEWSQADIMKLLNPDHESESVGGSLYYNSKFGTCYTGKTNATKSCDFTTIGIKNDITRNMILETTYNTGGWNTSEIYSNEIYEKERETTVLTSPSDGITRTTTWTGKIALPYPSDYGYAVDFKMCDSKLFRYASCTYANWMWNILRGDTNSWLLTPQTDSEYQVWHIYNYSITNGGNINNYNGFNSPGYIYEDELVTPVLYLSSEQKMLSGDGSQSNPYLLSVN